MAGTLAGEMLLIRLVGVRGTGVVAAFCSIAAGAASAFLSGRSGKGSREAPGEGPPWRLLFAAAISGFALLALEVVWFRVMILFVVSTTLTFAAMLAVVLAGIGLARIITIAQTIIPKSLTRNPARSQRRQVDDGYSDPSGAIACFAVLSPPGPYFA